MTRQTQEYRRTRRALIGLLLTIPWAAISARAWAQGTPAAPDAVGNLKLTAAQRDLIYSSVSKQTHTSTAAPDNWAARVGATVPPGVDLTPMPPTIVEMVPQTKGLSYAFVASQVLIVKSDSREVVEIITQTA